MARASPAKDSSKTIDIVSSITRVALPVAFRRQLQISQHKDLILQLSQNKRHLQEPSACDEAYLDLYLSNTQLAEAAEAYLGNYLATLESANIGTSCIVSGLDIDCDFQQTILGQQEFELACHDLGAQVVEFNMDVNCAMKFDGSNSTLAMHVTEAIDCIPADCEAAAQSVIGEAVVELENQLESAFLACGASSAECNV